MGIVNPCQIVIFYPEKQNKINHFVKHKKIFSAQDNIKKANLEFQLSLRSGRFWPLNILQTELKKHAQFLE